MIQFIAVESHGVIVTFRDLVAEIKNTKASLPEDKRALLLGLVEGVRGVAKTVGFGELRYVKTSKGKIFFAEAQKGASVLVGAEKTEMGGVLAKKIAEKLDNTPNIDFSLGVVDDLLIRSVKTVINTYIQTSLPWTASDLMTRLMDLLDLFDEIGDLAMIKERVLADVEKAQKVKFLKIKKDPRHLIKQGKFAEAFYSCLRCGEGDVRKKAFAVFGGFASCWISNIPNVRWEDILSEAEKLPDDLIVKRWAKVYAGRSSPHTIKELLKWLSENLDRMSEDDVALSLAPLIASYPEIAEKVVMKLKKSYPLLAEFFEGMLRWKKLASISHPDVRMVVSLLEEIEKKISSLRQKAKSLSEALRKSLHLLEVTTLIDVLWYSPFIHEADLKQIAEIGLRICRQYLIPLLEGKEPAYTRTVLTASELYVSLLWWKYLWSRDKKIVEEVEEFLNKYYSYLLRNYHKVMPAASITLHPVLFALFVFTMAGRKSSALFKNIYLTTNSINLQILQSGEALDPINTWMDYRVLSVLYGLLCCMFGLWDGVWRVVDELLLFEKAFFTMFEHIYQVALELVAFLLLRLRRNNKPHEKAENLVLDLADIWRCEHNYRLLFVEKLKKKEKGT